MTLARRHRWSTVALSIVAVAALAGCSLAEGSDSAEEIEDGSPVYFGVSSATTGQYAEYGEQFRLAFDLAVEEINAAGGIDGHPIELKYEDSQSDPKQSVTVAQKFVADSDVILVFGDYSSAASIPASPIYTDGELLQYGFNNSNPAFTEDGTQWQWSSAITTKANYTWTANYIKELGVDSVAVTYLNTADWGIPAFDAFEEEAERVGLEITAAEGIDATSDDYRPSLTKAVEGDPEAFVHVGYGPDAAKLVSQLRAIGYEGTFFGGQDEASFNSTPEAEGAVIPSQFVETSDDPLVQDFVASFLEKYPQEDDVTLFEATAYDALYVAAAAAEAGGLTREGILAGFEEIADVPSVIYGSITFDQETRRVADPTLTPTTLKDGTWTVYEG